MEGFGEGGGAYMCRCVRWKVLVRGIACVGVFTCAQARAHAADAIRCSRVEERGFYFRLADTSPGGRADS